MLRWLGRPLLRAFALALQERRLVAVEEFLVALQGTRADADLRGAIDPVVDVIGECRGRIVNEVEERLSVALGPRKPRVYDGDHLPTPPRGGFCDSLDRRTTDLRVVDHALRDIVPTGLELWLHEHDGLPAGLHAAPAEPVRLPPLGAGFVGRALAGQQVEIPAGCELIGKGVGLRSQTRRDLVVRVRQEAGIPTLARVAAWGGGFPIKVNGEVVGAIGLNLIALPVTLTVPVKLLHAPLPETLLPGANASVGCAPSIAPFGPSETNCQLVPASIPSFALAAPATTPSDSTVTADTNNRTFMAAYPFV